MIKQTVDRQTEPMAARLGDLSQTLRPQAPEAVPAPVAPKSFSDVLIATPLSWDHTYKRHNLAMAALHKHGAASLCIDGDAIDEMRNTAVEKAREMGAHWLFFVDADMVVPEDTLERLMAHDKPITGGLCRQRREPFNMCVWTLGEDGFLRFDSPEGTGLYECDATGGACLLIKMEVFDAIDNALPQLKGIYFLDARQLPQLKAQERVSEDMWFCAAARCAGYRVHVDMSLRIGHLVMGEVIDDGKDKHRAMFRLE